MADNKVKIVIDVEGKDAINTMNRVSAATRGVEESAGFLSKGLGGLASGFKNVMQVAGGILTARLFESLGRGVWNLAESFIEAAASEETFIRQMNFALDPMNKFSKAGEEMDDWLDNLSIRELRMFKGDQLQKAALDLENFGLSARDNLQLIGDVAAQMGRPIEAVVTMLQQFSMGNMRGLRQFGIDLQDVMARAGTFVTRSGFFSSSTQTVSQFEALMQILNERFRGAADTAKNDWSSMVTALGNYWDLFKEKVMGSGPFEVLKDKLRRLLDWLESPSGMKWFDSWTTGIGEWTATALQDIWDFAENAVSYLKLVFGSEHPWEMLWADMYETVTKALNWLMDYLRSKAAEWWSIGWNIGMGIYDGIMAALAKAWEALLAFDQRMTSATAGIIGGMHGGGFETESGMAGEGVSGGGYSTESTVNQYNSFSFGSTNINQSKGSDPATDFQERVARDIQSGRSPILPAMRRAFAR